VRGGGRRQEKGTLGGGRESEIVDRAVASSESVSFSVNRSSERGSKKGNSSKRFELGGGGRRGRDEPVSEGGDHDHSGTGGVHGLEKEAENGSR